jgi:hypothetical protein
MDVQRLVGDPLSPADVEQQDVERRLGHPVQRLCHRAPVIVHYLSRFEQEHEYALWDPVGSIGARLEALMPPQATSAPAQRQNVIGGSHACTVPSAGAVERAL